MATNTLAYFYFRGEAKLLSEKREENLALEDFERSPGPNIDFIIFGTRDRNQDVSKAEANNMINALRSNYHIGS